MRYHYFARPNELLLDLDSDNALDTFNKKIGILADVNNYVIAKGNSENKYHVFVTFNHDNISPLIHHDYAITLGSDPKREAANLARHEAGATQPIVLIRFQLDTNLRKPDWECACPKSILNKKTGEFVRLRTCYHLRQYKPFKWEAGTMKWKEEHQ